MAVKISPKYQVVIPESVRSELGFKPGMIVEVIAKGRVAYIVPRLTLSELQENLSGKLDQEDVRSKRDRHG